MATVVSSSRYPWPRQDKASLCLSPISSRPGAAPEEAILVLEHAGCERFSQWQGRGGDGRVLVGILLGRGPGKGCVWVCARSHGWESNDVTDVVDVAAAAATLPLQLPRNGVLCIVHCNIALTLTSSSGQPRKRVPSFGSRYYVEVHAGVLHWISREMDG